MPIHFEFFYSGATGWADWVDTELGFVNQCEILTSAKVLDIVFMTKKQVVHLEPNFFSTWLGGEAQKLIPLFVPGESLP